MSLIISPVAVLSIVGLATFLALGAMVAAMAFHTDLFHAICRSPMSFFDTTPVGRIINRFSKDLLSVDVEIPFATQRLLTCFATFLAAIVLVLYTVPLSAVVMLPLTVIFFVFQVGSDKGIRGCHSADVAL